MTLLRRLMNLWNNLVHRPRVERELDDEVRGYAEMLADEKHRAGMPSIDARRAANLELGGVEQVKELTRQSWVGFFLDTLGQDLRYAVRALAKSPGFTAAAVLALSLGIGANTAVFSVVNGVLLRPLPYPDADRIALVYMRFSPQNSERGPFSVADFLDWRAQNHTLEEPGLYSNRLFNLTGGSAEPEQVRGSLATATFFSVFGAQPLVGRFFLPGEDHAGAPRVAVLSEGLWRRRFGASPAVIGSTIEINGNPATVIGVAPEAFGFPRAGTELWSNLALNPPNFRGPFFARAFGRLRPGVTLEQAQAESNVIGNSIERAFPGHYSHLNLPVVPLREAVVGDVRPALLVMMGAVVFVLLIAAVNVANLLLARASARQREMAVRLSLGAARLRLLRQLLTESLLLSLAGGATGIFLAFAALQLLRAGNPGNLPRLSEVHLDGRVLLFTLAVVVLTGVFFGLAPALHSLRVDLNGSLKEGGRGGQDGASRHRLRSGLVVAQLALSMMLLIGAGLLLRSFFLLQGVNPGFQAPAGRLLSMFLAPPRAIYDNDARALAYYQEILERVRRLPGVQSAAVSDSLPPDRESQDDTFVIEGRPWKQEEYPSTSCPLVSDDYFQVLDIPLLRGRFFNPHDTATSPRVVIISESLARRYFPGQDPLGRRIKQSGPSSNSPYLEIVGVVGDSRYMGLERDAGMAYYQSFRQSTNQEMFLVVRAAGPAAAMAAQVRGEVQALEHDTVITHVGTMDAAISESVAQPRFRALLLGFFAGVALLLAAIGIYGVIAYSVAQRTHEIGIRMALGARSSDVLRLVMGRGALLAAAGIVLGLAGSLALTGLLSKLLFAVQPTDPVTFAGVSLGLAAVALLASFIPARRAAKIDPLAALRYE